MTQSPCFWLFATGWAKRLGLDLGHGVGRKMTLRAKSACFFFFFGIECADFRASLIIGLLCSH